MCSSDLISTSGALVLLNNAWTFLTVGTVTQVQPANGQAGTLGLKDRGTIAVGQKADLALWDVQRPGDLSYPMGFNPLAAVIRNGQVIRGTVG